MRRFFPWFETKHVLTAKNMSEFVHAVIQFLFFPGENRITACMISKQSQKSLCFLRFIRRFHQWNIQGIRCYRGAEMSCPSFPVSNIGCPHRQDCYIFLVQVLKQVIEFRSPYIVFSVRQKQDDFSAPFIFKPIRSDCQSSTVISSPFEQRRTTQ